jgi:hypothetical protein
MKNISISISVIIFILMFLSCGVSNKPKDVAEHFVKASLKMDFKEAKKYATPETAKMLDFVQNIAGKTSHDSSLLKDIKIEMGGEAINGDHAIVKYRKEGDKEEYSLTLEKVDGNWLVSSGMNRLNEGNAEAGEKELPADSDKAN